VGDNNQELWEERLDKLEIQVLELKRELKKAQIRAAKTRLKLLRIADIIVEEEEEERGQ
jgi:hypothetical protein